MNKKLLKPWLVQLINWCVFIHTSFFYNPINNHQSVSTSPRTHVRPVKSDTSETFIFLIFIRPSLSPPQPGSLRALSRQRDAPAQLPSNFKGRDRVVVTPPTTTRLPRIVVPFTRTCLNLRLKRITNSLTRAAVHCYSLRSAPCLQACGREYEALPFWVLLACVTLRKHSRNFTWSDDTDFLEENKSSSGATGIYIFYFCKDFSTV